MTNIWLTNTKVLLLVLRSVTRLALLPTLHHLPLVQVVSTFMCVALASRYSIEFRWFRLSFIVCFFLWGYWDNRRCYHNWRCICHHHCSIRNDRLCNQNNVSLILTCRFVSLNHFSSTSGSATSGAATATETDSDSGAIRFAQIGSAGAIGALVAAILAWFWEAVK